VKVDGLMRVCELDTLEDFIPPPPGDRGFEFPADVQECLRGHITHATRGPGLDMAVLCLELMEGRGTEFDSAAAAELWTTRLPWACLPRPERAAYRNLLNGLEPPRTALERNALREWTGTLARGCAWGRALPGRPEQAAGLAWRDARISHERNGIYAAMWTAATTSAAFVTDSPARALEVGLSEVPAHCRLADLLHEVQEGREAGWSAAEMVEEVMKASRSHSPMHVLSNAAVVAVALLWGDAEFSGTVGLAVQAGQDTSGNASAAGAVCGALVGAGAISDHWTEPLQDTLQTALAGTGPLSIRELADRTRRVQDRIAGRSGP
jgi:ADP-ribosylglycohydrolase